MPDTKTITIQHQAFEISEPYTEGHTCTIAEAKALNQTRGENVRNNMAKIIKAAREAAEITDADVSLPDAVVADLQRQVTAYDSAYEFTLASVGGGRKTRDPIEVEANRLAASAIAGALKADGRTVKEVKESNPDGYAELLAKTAISAEVMKAAKKAVAERNKIAESTLIDIQI